jgi:phytoene dehydrogenase-like protein
MEERQEILVIGGGLAGLGVATYLARDGMRVRLLERSQALGGRAATSRATEHALQFNVGPHALYRSGAAARVLAELGVQYSGGLAGQGAAISSAGELYGLPIGLVGLLRNRYFGLADKLALSRVLAQLSFVNPSALGAQSLSEWLDSQITGQRGREFMHMLVRLGTFVDAPGDLSAAVAVAQLKQGLAGVLYLDHGWQSLVDGLRSQAEVAGVVFETGARVTRVEHADHVQAVRLEDGRVLPAQRIVCAVGPKALAAMLPGDAAIAAFRSAATPVLLATLDLGLARLPKPQLTNVQALDRPLYYAVHSGIAHLSRDGSAVVHVAKYLDPNRAHDPAQVETELRAFLSELQPDYERELLFERFLPALVVHNALPRPRSTGETRFPIEHPSIGGLYCAGDWVSNHGMLADAALGSAREVWLRVRALSSDRCAA